MKSKHPPTRPVPDIGQGKRGVGGHPAYLLRQAAAASRAALDHRLAPLGLTHPQFVVLTMLHNYPGASGADLARLSLLTPQTLTVITRNLARTGLIRRLPPSPTHRRLVPYELTPAGLSTLQRARQVASDIESLMTAPLSPADRSLIEHWLVTTAERLHALTQSPQ